MVTVNINLYEFNELEKIAQEEAISNHTDFLNSINLFDAGEDIGDEIYELNYDNDEDRKIVIENILANAYLFYKDGSLASCTTYTGKHEKAGITEFKLKGEIYEINIK